MLKPSAAALKAAEGIMGCQCASATSFCPWWRNSNCGGRSSRPYFCSTSVVVSSRSTLTSQMLIVSSLQLAMNRALSVGCQPRLLIGALLNAKTDTTRDMHKDTDVRTHTNRIPVMVWYVGENNQALIWSTNSQTKVLAHTKTWILDDDSLSSRVHSKQQEYQQLVRTYKKWHLLEIVGNESYQQKELSVKIENCCHSTYH